MSKHQYSPKNFFRQVPNVLLNRYFHERDLLTDLDIASLDEIDVEPIYEAWLKLSASLRPEIEKDFSLADSVADEQGIVAILEEAQCHEEDLEPTFAEMSGFHEKAFWTFLEHPEYLEVAARFREADELPRHYWRDRNVPTAVPLDNKAGCERLADVLRSYFRTREGRGYACHVDVFRRGPLYYYFAYPEDHSKTLMEFEGPESQLQRRAHRPVFEIVFVYDPENGILSIYYHGKAQVVRHLQELFSRVILAVDLPEQERDQRVYELNAFKDRHFQFRYEPTSGISDVRVKQLRFAIIGGGSRNVLVDADTTRNREAVYDLMDGVLNTGGSSHNGGQIPLSMTNVTRVGIKAYFAPDGRRQQPTKTFYLTFPNSCSLKHEDKDLALRKMLIDSGIEPRVPEQKV